MKTEQHLPELWEWAEYYCPWSYVGAVRLRAIFPEYRDRVRLKIRPFPLESLDNDPAPRDILEQEWWLAAIQEPSASFAPYPAADWPTTTLPAFEAAWCASQQGDDALIEYDFRVRRGFFAEGRNIGRREVLIEVAEESGLDLQRFQRDFASGEAVSVVLDEAKLGREQYRVRGTPTLMLADGTKIRHPLATPRMRERRIIGVTALPCHGEGCLAATRDLFEQAIQHAEVHPTAQSA